jgi:hypothetical protein
VVVMVAADDIMVEYNQGEHMCVASNDVNDLLKFMA